MPAKILILGGTKDARDIAELLVAQGLDVTSSLAGVTQTPTLPAGNVRIGGFGGTNGLRAYLVKKNITILIDATHPYAVQISRNATDAVKGLDIQHFRFERPPWLPREGERWIAAKSADDAAELLPPGARVLLTIGRKEIAPFVSRHDLMGVIRTIELPLEPIPPNWKLVQERPPYLLEKEISCLTANSTTHLVTKNAGGMETFSKLAAAHLLGADVIMIERPHKYSGSVFHSTQEILRIVKDGC